jgi:hypothetical protein
MRMRFRSLESRIVTLFLVLIVAVQVVGLLVIQRASTTTRACRSPAS